MVAVVAWSARLGSRVMGPSLWVQAGSVTALLTSPREGWVFGTFASAREAARALSSAWSAAEREGWAVESGPVEVEVGEDVLASARRGSVTGGRALSTILGFSLSPGSIQDD